MRKLLEEIARVLREIAVEIHRENLSAVETERRLASLAVAVQKWADNAERTTEEKLDFLIFMSSKTVGDGAVVLSGEQMFKEWKAAVEKAKHAEEQQALKKQKKIINPKPIPNENQ